LDKKNYLNLKADELDRPIYRIVRFKRFQQLFDEKQNTLLSPALWDDPFENFILRCPVQLATGELASVDFHDQYFGQCWTQKSASDAMWRIYSKDKDGIRMRTTIRRLAASLADHCGEWASLSAFIGKVRYLNKPKLLAFAKQALQQVDPPSFAKTLLVKRPAFAHESEVRLVYFQRVTRTAGQKIYSYPVDPNSLIDQVMCHPRLSLAEYDALNKQVRGVGFAGEIKRSLLYAPPPKFVLRFGA
jgi:hypothetical protein